MKCNYEMTEADLVKILNACRPVPMIGLQCGTPRTPQENANAAWSELGSRMGFDPMTVEPTGAGDRFFTAFPSQTTPPAQTGRAGGDWPVNGPVGRKVPEEVKPEMFPSLGPTSEVPLHVPSARTPDGYEHWRTMGDGDVLSTWAAMKNKKSKQEVIVLWTPFPADVKARIKRLTEAKLEESRKAMP